jgi:hypothetical protein
MQEATVYWRCVTITAASASCGIDTSSSSSKAQQFLCVNVHIEWSTSEAAYRQVDEASKCIAAAARVLSTVHAMFSMHSGLQQQGVAAGARASSHQQRSWQIVPANTQMGS